MLSLTQTLSLKHFNPNTESGFFYGKENEGLILGNPRRVSMFYYQLQCHRELLHFAEPMLTAGHVQGLSVPKACGDLGTGKVGSEGHLGCAASPGRS